MDHVGHHISDQERRESRHDGEAGRPDPHPVGGSRSVTRTHQLTFNSADPGELYDLTTDPYQLRNVHGLAEYADVQRDLMARMERYMRELKDPLYGWFRRISGVY